MLDFLEKRHINEKMINKLKKIKALAEGGSGEEKNDIWDYLEEHKFNEPDYGNPKKKQIKLFKHVGVIIQN